MTAWKWTASCCWLCARVPRRELMSLAVNRHRLTLAHWEQVCTCGHSRNTAVLGDFTTRVVGAGSIASGFVRATAH